MARSMRGALIIAASIAICIVAIALLRELLIALDVVTLPSSVIGGAAGGGAVAGILIINRSHPRDPPDAP